MRQQLSVNTRKCLHYEHRPVSEARFLNVSISAFQAVISSGQTEAGLHRHLYTNAPAGRQGSIMSSQTSMGAGTCRRAGSGPCVDNWAPHITHRPRCSYSWVGCASAFLCDARPLNLYLSPCKTHASVALSVLTEKKEQAQQHPGSNKKGFLCVTHTTCAHWICQASSSTTPPTSTISQPPSALQVRPYSAHLRNAASEHSPRTPYCFAMSGADLQRCNGCMTALICTFHIRQDPRSPTTM